MPVAKKRRVDVDASVPGLVNSAYLMKARSWYDAVLSFPRGKRVRHEVHMSLMKSLASHLAMCFVWIRVSWHFLTS